MEIQYSRIKSYRHCRQQHYYKYIMNIVKKRPSKPLYRGSIIHECLQAAAEGRDWMEVWEKYNREFNRLFIEERELYGQTFMEDIKTILEGYFDYWNREDPLTYLFVEHQIRNIPIVKAMGIKFMLKAKIDGVVKDKEGRVWLIEHKTHENIPSEEVRLMDLQTILYIWALRKAGINVEGVLWDYIRAKPPAKPELLKNGQLTKRKNLDTTRAVYYRAIIENGLNPKHYEDILDRLVGREAVFYRRVRVPVYKKMIKPVLEDARATVMEMHVLQHYPVKNLGRHCEWCDYRNLCQAELRGLDKEFILQTEFIERKEDEYGEEVG